MTAATDHLARFWRRGLAAVGLLLALVSGAVLLASVGAPVEPGTAAPLATAPRDPDAAGRRERLAAVKSWRDLRGEEVPEAAFAQSADLIVIDPLLIGRLPQSEQAAAMSRLRRGPEGAGALVLAHLSVGAIEAGRPFWNAAWVAMGSSAVVRQSATAPYWDPSWHDQLYGRPEALLDRLIAAGYDGVVLADAEVHRIAGDVQDAPRKMADLIASLASYARRQNPYFVVVLGGSEELLSQPQVLAGIDAVAKHDLYHGLAGPGVDNDEVDVASSLLALRTAVRSGHPVFVAERVTADVVDRTRRRIEDMGFVADVHPRPVAGARPVWSKAKF